MLRKRLRKLPTPSYAAILFLLTAFALSTTIAEVIHHPLTTTAEEKKQEPIPTPLSQKNTKSSPAAKAYSLSLRQAMDIAKTANLDVLLSEERINEAIGLVQEARSELLPELEGIASWHRLNRSADAIGLNNQLPIKVPETIGPYNIFTGKASGKFPLINISAIQNWRAAKAAKQLSDYDLVCAQEEAMSLVASHYINTICNHEYLSAAEAKLVRDTQLLKLAKDKRMAGTATELDIMQAEVELLKAQENLETAKFDTINALLQLTNTLGIELNSTVTLTEKLSFIPVTPIGFDDALSLAFKRRPDLIRQLQHEMVAFRKKGAAVASLLPKVEAFGDYGDSGRDIDSATEVWSAIVQVNIPAWDSFKRHGDIKQSRSKLAQEKNHTLNLKRSIETEIKVGLESLRSKQNYVRIAQESLQLKEKELQLVNDKYKTGTATITQVIDAQSQLSDAEYQVVQKLYDYNIHRLNWFKILGNITEAAQQ